VVTSKGADYTAFTIINTDSQNNIYVRDIMRGRWDITGQIRVLFGLYEKYHFVRVGLQKIDWDRLVKVPLQAEMRRQQIFFPVTELKTYSRKNLHMNSKVNRILQLAPRYAAGSIYHVKECRNIKNLEAELLSFPRSKYDDCMDALSMSLALLFPAAKRENRQYPSWMDDEGVDPRAMDEFDSDDISGY
jgi:predicted phage terminase large subunit-like protein